MHENWSKMMSKLPYRLAGLLQLGLVFRHVIKDERGVLEPEPDVARRRSVPGVEQAHPGRTARVQQNAEPREYNRVQVQNDDVRRVARSFEPDAGDAVKEQTRARPSSLPPPTPRTRARMTHLRWNSTRWG